jgi:hypothetical protein
VSLVELAEKRSLPLFQFMDSETCDWIEKHNPRLGYNGKPSAIARPLFRKMRLSANWFQESRTIESIHGMRHLCRCGWYSLYLGSLLQLDECMTKNLVLAAMLHDIRREHDKDDPGHADRGATWFRSNAQSVQSFVDVSLSADDIDLIAVAIELHELPYDRFSISNRHAYNRTALLTDALKAVDALDRYRLPRLKWWLNDSQVKIHIPNWLKQTAFDIVLQTERDRSSGWAEPWKIFEKSDPPAS